MKKRSYAELDAERARLSKEATLAELALSASFRGKPNATERAKGNGDKWVFHLYDATRAHGGLVVEIYTTAGQQPYIWAHYLDDLMRTQVAGGLTDEGIARRNAITNLRIARDKLVSPPQEANQN